MNSNILIIDDDRTTREIVFATLKKNGFTVIQAANGKEGLLSVKDNKVDLILLDRNMPEIDGTTVLKTLQKYDQTSKIPVIMLTGEANTEKISESLSLGAKDYIVKPIDLENMVLRIRKLL